ncbi:hypothetical protein ACIKTA_16300, partial [Hansschlegelia beijingensis]
ERRDRRPPGVDLQHAALDQTYQSVAVVDLTLRVAGLDEPVRAQIIDPPSLAAGDLVHIVVNPAAGMIFPASAKH